MYKVYMIPLQPPSRSNFEKKTLIPTHVPVFRTCAFHIKFLVLCFSFAIEIFSMTRVFLIFKAGLYTIMNVCLSISAQLCCRIKVVSLWVQLNVRPTCVIITNISLTPVVQYNITNPASGLIVLFRNFLQTDFVRTIKEPWRYIILSLIPSKLMSHCVYLI